jgi:hypothetical protein
MTSDRPKDISRRLTGRSSAAANPPLQFIGQIFYSIGFGGHRPAC